MVSPQTRKLVRERALSLCEYCHSPEYLNSDRFTMEHLLPQSLGGKDTVDNLALACSRCNSRRYNFITAIDPETQKETTLFNPRQQQWSEHYVWSADRLQIIGKTSIGRATCHRLDLNDDRHNDRFIVRARALWLKGGWHPPDGDPCL